MLETFSTGIFYFFLFLSLYLEIFFLVTFFEERDNITAKPSSSPLTTYPSVTITVPCWNEEKTVIKTVDSLLNLNYPSDKLHIIIVDDGSTDATWHVIQQYAGHPQITLLQKENGGKHTAINLGISRAKTADIIGCLDADSFVEKNALAEIARAFNEDPEMMAATPTIVVYNPKTVVQQMQKTEYHSNAFLKRILSPLDAINVTPGPFSIFRRQVFEEIGLYEKAHNTEDMEMALRMQSHHMRIRNVHTARVYTGSPDTLYKLYRQRLRWMYGGIKNILDYRFMLFRPQYGILGMIVLPLSLFGIGIIAYNFSFIALRMAQGIFAKISGTYTAGFSASTIGINLFSINTDASTILWLIFFALAAIIIASGAKIAEGHFRPGMNILYFLLLYGIIAPIWTVRAVWNVVFRQSTPWR